MPTAAGRLKSWKTKLLKTTHTTKFVGQTAKKSRDYLFCTLRPLARW